LEHIAVDGLGAFGCRFLHDEYLFVLDHVIDNSLVEVALVVCLIVDVILQLFDDVDNVGEIRIVFDLGH
jgi:hypothetical protein